MEREWNLRSTLVLLVQELQEKSEKCPLQHPYNGILGRHLVDWQRILEQMGDGSNSAIVVILRNLKTTLVNIRKDMDTPKRWMPIGLPTQHDLCTLMQEIGKSQAELTLELLKTLKASPSSQRSSSDSLSQATTPSAAGPSRLDNIGGGPSRNGGNRQDTHLLDHPCSSPTEQEEFQMSFKKLCTDELALRNQRRGQKLLKDKRKEILAVLDLKEGEFPRSLPWVDGWNEAMLDILFLIVANGMDPVDKRHASKAILAIANKDSIACFFIAKNYQNELESLILFLASDFRPVLVELLSVLSKSPDLECQDVIVNGSGIEPLLEIVEDRESTWEEKKDAAVVLANLAKCPRAKKSYTEDVDFPRRAVQLIRTNEPLPVRVELIRALLLLMEEDTAAKLIRDADGLRAFAAVLEAHKRELADLIAAHKRDVVADALTTLVEQDLAAAKQALGEERLLSLLCQCQRPARSHVAALELINRILEEEHVSSSRKDGGNLCKRLIVQGDFQALQSILTPSSSLGASPKAKELTVTILLMLSRAYKDDYIASVLFTNQIWVPLFTVIEDSSSTDLAVENASKAFRNLSLCNDIMTQMEPKRVTKMLMNTIRRHANKASIVHIALMILEKFALSGELYEPSDIRLLVSLLGRWGGETELFNSTVLILGKLATGSGGDQKLCKIMLDDGAAQFLRKMLASNGTGRDDKKDIPRLLAWLVSYAPRKAPALDDLKQDSAVITNIKNLTKTDPGWKDVAVNALSKLK